MSELTCKCGKQYVRYDAFIKHKTLCQLVYKNTDKTIEKSESNYIPTNKELYIMLLELFNKYTKLYDDYTELKQYVSKVKKKIDVLEYLNTNYILDINFIDFISRITITISDIDYILENGYIKSISYMLVKYIQEFSQDLIPIKCFKEKDQLIYVYINNKWIILDSENEYKLFNIIDCKLLASLKLWKDERNRQMEDDKFNELYIKAMKQILVQNIKKLEVKKKLYKMLSISIP